MRMYQAFRSWLERMMRRSQASKKVAIYKAEREIASNSAGESTKAFRKMDRTARWHLIQDLTHTHLL